MDAQDLYRWDCGDNYFRANGLCVLLEEETSVAPFGNWDTQLQLCPECRHQYAGGRPWQTLGHHAVAQVHVRGQVQGGVVQLRLHAQGGSARHVRLSTLLFREASGGGW